MSFVQYGKKLSVLATVLLATSAYAAPTVAVSKKEPVQVVLEQFKIVVDNGKETQVSAAQVKPGEIIEYRVTYKNTSKAAVKNLIATLPVPKGLEYQDKTANPLATAEASIDKINFAAMPLMDATKKPIPLPKYRALRWKLQELGADKHVMVSARMKVSQE